MNYLKTISFNTFSQVLARGISSGASFVVLLLVAHFFGVLGYGDIAKITAFVAIVYLFIDLGANAIFLQLKETSQDFAQFLSFRLLLSFVLFVVIAIVSLILPYNSINGVGYSPIVKQGIILFSLSFFSRAVVFSTTALFQKKLIYEKTVIASLIGSVITLACVVASIALRSSILWIIGAYIIGDYLEAGTSLVLSRQKVQLVKIKKTFIKPLLIGILPLSLLLLVNLFYFRIDMILLTLFKSTQDVGIYDFAYKFFDFLISLPLFLSNSLYPKLIEKGKNFRIGVRNISLYTGIFLMLGVLFALIAWLATPLLGIIKSQFIPSEFALRLLVLSLPIFFATSILQWILIAKKKQAFLIFVYCFLLIFNIVANLVFIPHYSYIASAIITGVSELLVFALLLIYSYTHNI